MSHTLYLDYAASTPVDPRVLAVMLRYLGPEGCFANPGSPHHLGQAAAAAVALAREQVATLLRAQDSEIVFTSGATESINLALRGVMRAYARRGRHLITAKTEHKAVLDTCAALEREGCQVTYLDPDSSGRITAQAVAEALTPKTQLVSLMHVNNETGAVNDITAIGALCAERGVLFHVDAAQSAGKLPLDVHAQHIALLSLSGHKLYAPKGIGALYVRRLPKVRLEPLLTGGGQEQGLRSGTQAVHQIVALGAACAIARREQHAESERIAVLREWLWQGLASIADAHRNTPRQGCAPGILSVSFPGITAQALLADIPQLALSAGSACTSAQDEPSHVLLALGLAPEVARATLRFSLGRYSNAADIDHVTAQVTAAVSRLRALSPLWPDAA